MKKFICLAVLVISLYVCGSSKPDNAIKTNTPAKTKTEIIHRIGFTLMNLRHWVFALTTRTVLIKVAQYK
jgi:hypothetical protein